ncbi:MAG: hypothetical protein V3V40_06515 [Nitrosomonadaceae bacterium]
MFKSVKLLFLAIALLMLPLTGYTMSYNQGFVDGVDHQQFETLQTETESLSAFVGESEADLFNDDIVSGATTGSTNQIELSMATQPTMPEPKEWCMAGCYNNPEVGWRGSL